MGDETGVYNGCWSFIDVYEWEKIFERCSVLFDVLAIKMSKNTWSGVCKSGSARSEKSSSLLYLK